MADVRFPITVRVNGLEVPAFGPDGLALWRYNPEEVSIDFDLLALPAPGSVIVVECSIACLQ